MKSIYFALLDQILVSGSNFLLSLILARFLSGEEYGLYIFGLTTLTVMLGLANSTLFGSLSVLSAPLLGQRWRSSIKGHALLFLLLIVLSVGTLTAIGALLGGGPFLANGKVLFATSAILFLHLGHEFGRVSLLSLLKSKDVFIGDCIGYGGRMLLVLGAIQCGVDQGWQLIIIFGGPSLVGVLYFWHKLDMGQIWTSCTVERSIFLEMFRYSKWTFAEWVPFVLSGQLYVYVVTFVLGNEANGALVACRNLVMPVTVLLVGVMNYSLPYYSRMFNEKGVQNLLASLKKYFAALVTLVIGYLFLIYFFRVEILYIIYGKFVEFNALVPLFAIGLFANVIYNPAEIFFRVTRKPKFLFFSRLVSAVVTTVACYPLVTHYGINGAVYSYILSQLTMGLVLYLTSILHTIRRRRPAVVNSVCGSPLP